MSKMEQYGSHAYGLFRLDLIFNKILPLGLTPMDVADELTGMASHEEIDRYRRMGYVWQDPNAGEIVFMEGSHASVLQQQLAEAQEAEVVDEPPPMEAERDD